MSFPGCAIWGVLNITPDSFSDGGKFVDPDAAFEHARALVEQGADVIDVGGESSRPAGRDYGAGAARISAAEEIDRIVPVIERIHRDLNTCISVDTVRAEVATAAIAAGARIVNDVSAASSESLVRVVAEAGAELCLMHNRGRGEVTASHTDYGDVVEEVREELLERVEQAVARGVERNRIWIDPGIGFAKTPTQSLQLLAGIGRMVDTKLRVLVGPSRKSFIAHLAPDAGGRRPPAEERLGGTIAAALMSVAGGAAAVRVHDVHSVRQSIRLWQAGSGS